MSAPREASAAAQSALDGVAASGRGLALASESYLARQAIFERQMHTAGYELLFRTAGDGAAAVPDDAGSARAVVAALADIGLDALGGEPRACLTAGRRLISEGQIRVCPADRVVVQVSPDFAAEPAVVDELRTLVGEGYELAIDDFTFTPEVAP